MAPRNDVAMDVYFPAVSNALRIRTGNWRGVGGEVRGKNNNHKQAPNDGSMESQQCAYLLILRSM